MEKLKIFQEEQNENYRTLKRDTIILNLTSTTKTEVIDELVNKLDNAGRLNNKTEYKNAILAREADFSTEIGDGIAIPHAKTAAVKTPALALGISKKGIDYDSLDGNPAYIFFMIAASEGAHSMWIILKLYQDYPLC